MTKLEELKKAMDDANADAISASDACDFAEDAWCAARDARDDAWAAERVAKNAYEAALKGEK